MRSWTMRLALLAVLSIVTACSGGGTGTPASTAPAKPISAADALTGDLAKQWADLVAAAKAEGQIVFITGVTGPASDEPLYQEFGKRFGLKVTSTGGSSDTVTSRVLLERSQGVYSVDITASIGNSGITRLLGGKTFTPLLPQLFHPEALDRKSGWRMDTMPWQDPTSTFCTYHAIRATRNFNEFWYNTKTVSAADLASIKSWKDLLAPRWKGKIGMGNVAAGEQSTNATAAWMNLGKDWWDGILRSKPVIFPFGSQREQADALSRGEFDLALFPPIGVSELQAAQQQGLPVAEFPRTLAEGTQSSLIERLCVMDKAPHPASAKLFANWILTREGQAAFNQYTGHTDKTALRSDVPQGNVPADTWSFAADQRLPLFSENTDAFRAAAAESKAFFIKTFQELGYSLK